MGDPVEFFSKFQSSITKIKGTGQRSKIFSHGSAEISIELFRPSILHRFLVLFSFSFKEKCFLKFSGECDGRDLFMCILWKWKDMII